MIRRRQQATPSAVERAITGVLDGTAHPALPLPGPSALITDEFLETLRRRILIPFVDRHSADLRLSVAHDLPPAIDAAVARRLWHSTREGLRIAPRGARICVHVARRGSATEVGLTFA